MSTSHPFSAFAVASGGIIGWSLGYAAPAFLHLQNAFYDPVTRVWSWTEHPSPLPLGYFGQIGYGTVGAVLGCALALVLTSTIVTRSKRVETLLSAWSLTALSLSLFYFVWHNWP